MMWSVEYQTVRGFYQRAAAPEGGAQKWVRGCAFGLLLFPTILTGQTLPSGQAVELYEVLIDKVGDEDWLRFRFLAPEIARDLGRYNYRDVAPDMTALCEGMVLDYMAAEGLGADKIAIALIDRPVPFGQPDPEATQFIELYRVENGRCIWEVL